MDIKVYYTNDGEITSKIIKNTKSLQVKNHKMEITLDSDEVITIDNFLSVLNLD